MATAHAEKIRMNDLGDGAAGDCANGHFTFQSHNLAIVVIAGAVIRYRAQFRLDPRHARIDSGSLVFAAGVDVGAGIAAFEIGLGQTAGGYVITLVAGENNGRSLTSSVLVPARPILIEIDWSARSSAAQRGHARLLIDGRLVAQLTHLDNDQLSIERLRLGAIAGFGNGNSGRLRLYDFVSVD